MIDLRYGKVKVAKSLFNTDLDAVYDLFKKWKITPMEVKQNHDDASLNFYVWSPYFGEAIGEFNIPRYIIKRLVDVEENVTLTLEVKK